MDSGVAFESLGAELLPKWLLLISLVSCLNSLQSYLSLVGTQRVYLGPVTSPRSAKSTSNPTPSSEGANSPVTPLSARTFGTWTFLSAVIRIQAALAIHSPIAYRLAFASFPIAAAHFGLEWFVYGTARWGKGLAGPVFVSTGTTLWMLLQWSYYIKG